MAFTNCTVTVNNIASLSDLPNVTDGLSAATLKGKFDQTGTDLKTFLNSTLLTELANTGSGTSASENIGGRSIPAVTGSSIISAGTLYTQLVAIQGKIGGIVTGTGFMPTSGGTFTGEVSFPDGTAALPSIRHVGDTDTGLFFPTSNNAIAFSNAGTEGMRLTNNLLGIGTSSPKGLTHINANTTTPSFTAITGANLLITGLDSTVNAIQMDSFAAENQIVSRRSSGTLATPTATASTNYLGRFSGRGYQTTTGAYTGDTASIQFRADEAFTSTANGTSIRFSTTPLASTTLTEKVIIDTSGNLGISTMSPAAKLHVSGTLLSSTGTSMFVTRFATTNVTPDYQFFGTDAGSAILAGRFSADASSSRIYFAKSRNATAGSHTVVQSGDQLGLISFGGSDGTNISEGARISAEVDGTPGANDMPGRLVFLTTADGSATPTERLRISSTGLLTSPQTYAQLVTASVRTVLVDSAGQIGNATSSLRHKESVEDLTVNIEDVLKLEAKTFFYKEDVKQNGENAIRTVGFIAEQAKDLGLTYLYNEDENGIPDYFAYDKLSVYLLKVIQEQQATIESLTARLELLESKVV